ncbi:Alpha/Beta hydrolase protein [Aspergillus aurantiobrunneus]
MSIRSDLSINPSRFHPDNVAEPTKQANTLLEGLSSRGPRWYEVGAAEYRQMRDQGKLPLPAPTYLPNAVDATLPSRDSSRAIPIRVYKPDNGEPSKGVFLHFHGGGFVLGNEKSSDKVLQMFANGVQLTAISVGYRHAPEDPYPAAVHDSIDAAEYLVDHPSIYGPVRFMGGESAGACLVVLATLHLLHWRPSHVLSGLILHYGFYDLSLGLPALATSTRPLMVNRTALEHFTEAYLPGVTPDERRSPSISPIYADFPALAAGSANGLPPALFIVGTEDCLLDDTILLGTKWRIAGGESLVQFYPGASHGFTVMPGLPVAEEANAASVRFLQERVG